MLPRGGPTDSDQGPAGGQPILGIVAECGPGIGNGHLGRCLALAQAWRARTGAVALVASGDLPAGWADRYRRAGVTLIVGGGLEQLFEDDSWGGVDLWVVDGYGLPAELPGELGVRAPVAVIDDGGRRGRYDATWIVDQNLGATSESYRNRADGCRLLLGERFAMLRTEVTAARPAAPPDRRSPPRRLLVSLGGDPSPQAIARFAEATSAVRLEQLGLERVDLVGVADVGRFLADIDLALVAAGSTVWELCLMGVPAVVTAIVDNQKVVARHAGQRRVVVDAGDLAEVTPDGLAALIADLMANDDERQAMSERAWALIDGRGADRVAVALRGGLLRLRPAVAADEDQLWRWTNDPAVRSNSFSPAPIPLDVHQRWLADRLVDASTFLWIATLPDGSPLGQVRVSLDGSVGILGYSIASEHRGLGWGPALLDAASRALWESPSAAAVERIDALVQPGNIASDRVLRAADFVRGPDGSSEGRPRYTYARFRHH